MVALFWWYQHRIRKMLSRQNGALCSLYSSFLAESFTLALGWWSLVKVMAIVCTNLTQCLTLSSEYLKGKMALVQKCWIINCEQCRECRGTVICGSCGVFKFLGSGVVTTCDIWNHVGSSTAEWLPPRESSAVANSLWDGVHGLIVQVGKHREMCAVWWKCFLSMFSYGMHFGAIWRHSNSQCWVIFQLYLWSCPFVMLLAADRKSVV